MLPVTLHDYQQQMLKRIEYEFSCKSRRFLLQDDEKRCLGRSVMVQMPTGTGKTYLMAAVVGGFLEREDGEVWIVAHRRELVEQTERVVSRFGMEYMDGIAKQGTERSGGVLKQNTGHGGKKTKTGMERGGKKDKPGGAARIRVMSVQWLSRHCKEMAATPALIVIDEAHHALADTYQEMWTRYPEARKLGLTATPCRMQKKGFDGLFDVLLTSWSINEFIRKGYLSMYDYVVINRNSEEQMRIDSLEKRGADGDYSISEMGCKLNNEQNIVRLYQSVERYAGGRKGIVYAIDISHAKMIARYYAKQGLRTVAIDSKTPAKERDMMVMDFREGRLDCIVNVNLFDEGFDCPDVEFIQMARPTLSLSKYMQMIGRGLRPHPNKELCVLIDNAGLYRVFGLPNIERDWQSMFHGHTAGKGRIVRVPNVIRRIDNTMEVIVNHSKMMTDDAQNKYLQQVEPFEQGGLWGLRVKNDIVLRPIYRYISSFVGDFCTFEMIPGRWGVLRRNGKRCIPPEFKSIELLPGGDAMLMRNEISKRRIHIDTTFTNKKDIDEWWGEDWA